MDGIEKITNRIESDVQKQIVQLEEEANRQIAEIGAEYQAKADRVYAQMTENGRTSAEEIHRHMKSTCALESKKRDLAAKQSMIDLAISNALDVLCTLPADQKIKLFARLCEENSQTGSEHVILNATDREAIGNAVVQAANSRLADKGKIAHLVLSDHTHSMQGGVYLQNGQVEANCTFEALIRLLRREMAGQVAGILFD